jgi:hypothetical protein
VKASPSFLVSSSDSEAVSSFSRFGKKVNWARLQNPKAADKRSPPSGQAGFASLRKRQPAPNYLPASPWVTKPPAIPPSLQQGLR